MGKAAKVIYVAHIPKERSHIGADVPAHVKLDGATSRAVAATRIWR